MGKIMIINGSPRAPKSNSKQYADLFAKSCTIPTQYFNITKNNHLAIEGLNVKAIDTTGAGDSFIGAFIYQLLKNKDYDLANIAKERLEEYLKFANYYGAYMTSVEGALASLADQKTIDEFIKLVNS